MTLNITWKEALIAAAVGSAIGLGFATLAGAEPLLTNKTVAEYLERSVVAVIADEGSYNMCSAAKIGPHQFLTARHCVTEEGTQHLETKGGRILHIKSVLTADQKKAIGSGDGGMKDVGDRFEDWAVFNTVEDDDIAKALELACTEVPYMGQEIAYGGYPWPTQFTVAMGHVTSTKPVYGGVNSLDIAFDAAAGPGASGSSVISMETGRVLGVLTEGVLPARNGWGVQFHGLESIANTDMCDAPVNEVKKQLGVVLPEDQKIVAPTEDALTK